MKATRFQHGQLADVRRQKIRETAPQYIAKLRAENALVPEIWTDEALLEDTVDQLDTVMETYDLVHPDDLYRYLALRHQVGPRLHSLGRFKQHMARDTSPPGMRILSLLATVQPSYWYKIRGSAEWEGEETFSG
jgi:hypothetical protein